MTCAVHDTCTRRRKTFNELHQIRRWQEPHRVKNNVVDKSVAALHESQLRIFNSNLIIKYVFYNIQYNPTKNKWFRIFRTIIISYSQQIGLIKH